MRAAEQRRQAREFCEDCLSVLCEFRSSRVCRAAQGTPDNRKSGAVNLGGILFGYFILAAQEKVTSRRAAPGHKG